MLPRNMRIIRSATPVSYPKAARAVGLDPEKMLFRVGLDMWCMENHETIIALDAYFQLLADSARTADCQDFGTRASIQRGMPNYGAVGLLMQKAETIEQAINFKMVRRTLNAGSPAKARRTPASCNASEPRTHGSV